MVMKDARFKHDCDHIITEQEQMNYLDFNGTSDFVELPAGYDLTQFSIECWINTDGTGNQKIIYLQGLSGAWIRLLAKNSVNPPYNRTILYNVKNDDSVASAATDGLKVIDDNKWYQLFLVLDGINIRTYVNNVFDRPGNLSGVFTCSDKKMYFASQIGTMNFYKKYLRNVRIYNKALNNTERQNNFNGHPTWDGLIGEWLMKEQTGNILHDSVGTNHGTITGATWGTFLNTRYIKYKDYQCPRCLGKGYYYDLKVTPTLNDVVTVTGATKLGQELVKRTLELEEIRSIIGRVDSTTFSARLKSALLEVISATADSQSEAFLLGGDYPDTELIDRVERVDVTQIDPRHYWFEISLITRSGKNIKIKDTLSNVAL